ncbi:unnamed protein product [Urochloa humidicola]
MEAGEAEAMPAARWPPCAGLGRLVSPPAVDLRPLSPRAICLGDPHPSPRRQFLASRRRRPRPHGLRRCRRQAVIW